MARREIEAGAAFVRLFVKGADLQRGLSAAKQRLQSFASGAAAIGGGMLAGGAAIMAPLTYAVKQASTIEELTNKFNAVFGADSAAVGQWAESFRAAVGRSKEDTLTGLSAFRAFFAGLGMGSNEAVGLSEDMQRLAVDFGSFHNLTDAESIQRFISAMSGSSEVLDMFGINIKEAALNQKMLQMGFPKTTKGATEMQKVMARTAIIREAMGRQGAIGDAEKTAGSFANRLKAAQAGVKDLAGTVGAQLLPVVTDLLDRFVGFVPLILDFATNNAWLVQGAAGLGLSLLGMGGGLLAVATAAKFASIGIAGISSALTLIPTLIAPFAALMGPGGLMLVGLGLVTAAWLTFRESGQETLSVITTGLQEQGAIWSNAYSGIKAALLEGDLAAAGNVAMAGLTASWRQGLADLLSLTGGFAKGVVEVFANIAGGIARIWVDMQTGIAKKIISWASQEGAVGDVIRKALGVDPREEMARQQRIQMQRGGLSFKVSEWRRMQDEAGAAGDTGRVAEIQGWIDKALAQMQETGAGLTPEQLAAGGADEIAQLLDQRRTEAQTAIDEKLGNAISSFGQWADGARDRAEQAKTDLQTMVNPLEEAVPMVDAGYLNLGGDQETKLSEGMASIKGPFSGTFSAAAAAYMGGGAGTPAERTARGVEKLYPILQQQQRRLEEMDKHLAKWGVFA